jgi:hypothetical protein
MKFGNPKMKSHNVQMNRKPIKDLKKYALGQKNLGNVFFKFKRTFEKNAILSFSKVHN